MTWLRMLCAEAESTRAGLEAQLLAAGLKLSDCAASTAGIVFFDQPGSPVIDLVRETSRGGLARVLAVAARRVPAAFAWQLVHAGASDVLDWGQSPAPAEAIAARLRRWSQLDHLVTSSAPEQGLVGQSPAWIASLRQVVEAAAFTDGPVLLLGESGTGKELLARLIHTLDPRPNKRALHVLDCTTIVPELSGSEFFGHERGAFTGALAARDGAFALADGGTLFLDEIGELPLPLQAQLLRVVQEHTYKRVGGNTWHRSTFRLVCATNRDLSEEVRVGRFRSDLFHRIASRVCRVVPLRERPDDILPLVRHFLRELRAEPEAPELDEPVRAYLVARDYPGNVRDLRQLVARVCDRYVPPGPITVGCVPADERPSAAGPADWRGDSFSLAVRRAIEMGACLDEIRRAAVDVAIKSAVDAESGSLQRAARRLGVTDRALQLRRATHRPPPGPAHR